MQDVLWLLKEESSFTVPQNLGQKKGEDAVMVNKAKDICKKYGIPVSGTPTAKVDVKVDLDEKMLRNIATNINGSSGNNVIAQIFSESFLGLTPLLDIAANEFLATESTEHGTKKTRT